MSLIAKAPEGKLVVAGVFSSINGHASPKVIRFNQNGSVDQSFVSLTAANNSDDIRSLAVQFDDRVVLGGLFTEFGGHSAQFLVRLLGNGLYDPTFHFHPQPGDQIISAITTLDDGRMIVTGGTYRNGFAQSFCRRLLADGSDDSSFQLGVNGFITSLLALPDGKVLLGGSNFRVTPTSDRYRVVRLNSDGSWDSTWNYGLVGSSGGAGVSAMALQADGKLVVGLPGFSVGPVPIERVLADGTVDSGFHPGNIGTTWTLGDFDLEPDGKILVAINGSQSVTGVVVRVSVDGSLDSGFSTAASGNGDVRRIGLLPDGTAMVFGAFTSWSAAPVQGIARLSVFPTAAKVFSMIRTAGADELWEGAHQEFSVVAGGTPDPTFQWTQTGASLPDQLGEKLVLDTVAPGQAGIYNVMVSNTGGSDVGAGFQLKVKSGPPELLADLLDDQEAHVGGMGVLQGFAVGGPLPKYQWFRDGVAIDGQTGSSLVLSNLPAGIDGSVFTLLAQNSHGSVTSAPLHFLIRDYGDIVPEFALEKRFTATFNSPSSGCVLSPVKAWPTVNGAKAIAVQRDGRIIIAGGFYNNSWVLGRIQRLMADGSQDTSFPSALSADAPEPDNQINAVAIGVDDRIWIGGFFTQVNFIPRKAIARLNSNGVLDQTFAPALTVNDQPAGEVDVFARQNDGKMIAAGNFEKVNGSLHPFIVRFNLDGSVDESFQGTLQYYNLVAISALAVQRDGKILVGSSGALSTVAKGKLIRLNTDGSIDDTFTTPPQAAAFTAVGALAIDAHERILVGAGYVSPGDPSRPSIMRLTDDGDVDSAFNAAPDQGTVFSIAVQPNGRILVGGQFPTWGDNQTHSVARLKPDGSVDESFTVKMFTSGVSAIELTSDGLLVAGAFQGDERFAGKIGDCTLSALDGGLVKLKLGDITTLEDPPDILEQPHGGIFPGGDITLKVTAIGAAPFTYSWSREGRVLAGANSATYTINNAKPEQSGSYRVRVENKFGSILSEAAQVDVLSSFGGTTTPTVDASGFKFNLALINGHFEAADVQNVSLQMSEDLELWQTIDAQIQLVNGEVQLVDPGAVLKPQRFYRFVWGTAPPPDPTAVSDNSDLVPVENLPAIVRHAAELHLQEFIKPPATGHNATVGGAEWIGVTFASQARYLYDPAYHDGNDPAYVEFKMIHTPSQTPRGYMLVSMNEEDFPILEFSTAGATKTERVLAQAKLGTVHKFFRLTPAFYSGEDSNGNPVALWGTEPAKADLTPLGATTRLDMSFDSENGTTFLPPRAQRAILSPYANYSELKTDLKTNPERLRIRSLRVAQAATHWVPVRGETYPTLHVALGDTNVFFPTQPYTSARVDADDDVPNVSAAALREGGVQVVGLRLGNDIVRFRTAAGSVLAYTIIVDPKGLLSQKKLESIANGDCEDSSNQDFWAGSGWEGDQRQYWQMQDNFLWCPDVGCGPVALAMLLGWWDYNGVPSAFYRLKSRTEGVAALIFRFDYSSIRNSDAPKRFYSDGDPDGYALMHDVYEDLNDLCNTFCFPTSEEGATYPDQMASAFVEYIQRVADPQLYPMNEFGDRFVGGEIHAHWVPPGGMTDWEGGGTLVADGIKEGRPGVVGIGLTLFDGHYPLAYVYRRHSHYIGCGSDRHRDSLSRFFKLNMGWGPKHSPEWTNAEDVWFGLTANLYQRKLPVWTKIKGPLPIPGILPY